MDSNFLIPLFLLFPASIFIFSRIEGLKINKKKAFAVSCMILLLWVTPSLSFQPAFADSNVKRIIKIEADYPADSASADFVIHPPLTDITKAFAIVSFSHTGETDHSNTFRSYEILDSDTLRIYGETTATGNNAQEFIAYIVEFEGDILVQKGSRTWATSESAGEKSVTIPTAITLAESFLLSSGHDHDADETTIGSEELDRLRLLTTTTWGQLIFTNPNSSPQNNLVQIIDWNDSTVVAQRGITTLASGSASTTINPSTSIDRTRTILLVTYTCGTGCATSEAVDDIMLRATINVSNQIVITRIGTEDALQIAWSVIQFPADQVKVQHDSVTLSGGTTVTTDTFGTAVRDFDKSIVMSTVGTPYGWGTGTCTDTTDGAVDRCMLDLQLYNEQVINVERGDSTGTAVIEYQVIEFLEKNYPQATTGTNTLRQVAKIDGVFTAGNVFQDFTISPALQNITKSMVFMTMNSTNIGESSENGKMWEIINPTTLRVYGSGTATNDGAEFRAKIVEFDSSSPIFVQYDNLQYPEDLQDNTRSMWISTVNTTNSFILGQGSVMEDGDPTFGQEEFPRVTLTGSNSWLYQTELQQDSVETAYRAMIADFNQDDIFVQRGTGILTGSTISVSPPIDVDREDSLVFVNFMTDSATFGEFPNRTAISATLDASSPTDIVVQRNTVAGGDVLFAWQVITFPEDFISVQHGIHHQNAGIVNNTSSITPVGNLTTAFSIGTVGGFYTQSMGRGSSTTENNFDAVFALMQLDDASTLRVERGDGDGSFDLGYQVAQFQAGQVFDQDIIDVVAPVDFATDLTVTKENTDLVITLDDVILQLFTIFNQNQTDTVTVNDIVTTIVNTVFNNTETEVIDVQDGIQITATFNQTETDLTTILDQIQLAITKELGDDVTINDSTITIKSTDFNQDLSDVVIAFDQVDIVVTVTKNQTDVVLVLDQVELDVTTIFNENPSDIATILDEIRLEITKNLGDIVIVTDDVRKTALFNILVNDQVVVNEALGIIVSGVVPPTGGGGAGGGTPPSFQRLIGLLITSEVINVQPASVVPSDFTIKVFGQQFDDVFITSLITTPQFSSWFAFSSLPDELDFNVVIDNELPVSDPRRTQNIALDDFVVNAPNISCAILDPFDPPQPCLDPILYEVPVEFTFTKGGVPFHEKHTVIVDARVPVVECNLFGLDYPVVVCDVVQFVFDNWYWWVLLFVASYIIFILSKRRSGGFRVVRRVRRDDLTSMSDRRVRTKFKRGKR